jgi:hypothetical protein
LTWPVLCAVLFGALLHAGWNALVKSSADKSHGHGGHPPDRLGAGPAAGAAGGLPPVAAWPFIGASVLIHIGYYIAPRRPTNTATWA